MQKHNNDNETEERTSWLFYFSSLSRFCPCCFNILFTHASMIFSFTFVSKLDRQSLFMKYSPSSLFSTRHTYIYSVLDRPRRMNWNWLLLYQQDNLHNSRKERKNSVALTLYQAFCELINFWCIIHVLSHTAHWVTA